jgi:hypothetical protein
MSKPKRVYKAEVELAPALQVELVPSKQKKNKEKEALDQGDGSQRFETDLILGIIERIKKL